MFPVIKKQIYGFSLKWHIFARTAYSTACNFFLGRNFLTTKQERLQENNHTIKVSKVIVVTNIKKEEDMFFSWSRTKLIPSLVITLAHFDCKINRSKTFATNVIFWQCSIEIFSTLLIHHVIICTFLIMKNLDYVHIAYIWITYP